MRGEGAQSSNGINSHLHFAKLCQKTRMGCSNWVAVQFKVLIVFHSGCSLNSKVCSCEQLRRRGGKAAFTEVEAKRWDGGAIGLQPNPLILQSHWFQPHNELCSHWSSSRNLGRAGGELRICVAFGKDFPQAAQAYFSSGSTGFAQQ